MSEDGLVYAFGANSFGQVQIRVGRILEISDLNYMKPRIVGSISSKFRNELYDIQCGNFISGVSIDFGKHKNFYAWGGKTIIGTISSAATVHGSETVHGGSAHARGGSQNVDGITLLDTQTEYS